jgi:hypothetical protein
MVVKVRIKWAEAIKWHEMSIIGKYVLDDRKLGISSEMECENEWT